LEHVITYKLAIFQVFTFSQQWVSAGLSAVVAKRMMQNSGLETSVLPLVARSVSSAPSAQTAAAGEGADLLILDVNDKDKNAGDFVKEVCDRISIPVFIDVSGSGAETGLDLLQDGANGLVLNAVDIGKAGREGGLLTNVSSLLAAISVAIERRTEMEMSHSPDSIMQSREDDKVDVEDGGAFLGLPEDVVAVNVDMEQQSVTKQVKQIVNEERVFLTAMVDFVKDASPDVSLGSVVGDKYEGLSKNQYSWIARSWVEPPYCSWAWLFLFAVTTYTSFNIRYSSDSCNISTY